ncbi:MAG: rhodanese-like domain-containing protein [Flavobacteriaceae bacterium]|nr:rhodanese-like domain-containing protein [Flavobacteriaceae bacterium]
MHRFLFILLILISCGNVNQPLVKYISESEFLESSDDFKLIDVRTKSEYESGFIERALNIDFFSDTFESDVLSLNKNSKIILYCRTNNRSTKTANLLKKNGFKDISVIEGGITDWVKNGNDIVYPKLD